jgi:DNA-binding MurR/RpiR family transcriptional regulator
MNLLNYLKTSKNFTSTEKKIVDFILQQTDLVLHNSIAQIASFTYTSTSSIVRLCKKCGFTGFKEFKIALQRDFVNSLNSSDITNFDTPFDSSDSTPIIAKKLKEIMTNILIETQHSLNYEKIEQAVKLLNKADKIIGIGVSDSYLRLKDFQLKLLKINILIDLVDFQAEQFHLAHSAKYTDVAIIVSNSGNTTEVINDAKILTSNNVPIIAITSNSNSLLAKEASIILLVPENSEKGEKISNFSSQTST